MPQVRAVYRVVILTTTYDYRFPLGIGHPSSGVEKFDRNTPSWYFPDFQLLCMGGTRASSCDTEIS